MTTKTTNYITIDLEPLKPYLLSFINEFNIVSDYNIKVRNKKDEYWDAHHAWEDEKVPHFDKTRNELIDTPTYKHFKAVKNDLEKLENQYSYHAKTIAIMQLQLFKYLDFISYNLIFLNHNKLENKVVRFKRTKDTIKAIFEQQFKRLGLRVWVSDENITLMRYWDEKTRENSVYINSLFPSPFKYTYQYRTHLSHELNEYVIYFDDYGYKDYTRDFILSPSELQTLDQVHTELDKVNQLKADIKAIKEESEKKIQDLKKPFSKEFLEVVKPW